MKKIIISIIFIALLLSGGLCYLYRTHNLNDIVLVLLNISEDEHYKMQMVEAEYLLRNSDGRLENVLENSLNKNEEIIVKDYNNLQVNKNDNSNILVFKDIAKNGMPSSKRLKGRYIEIRNADDQFYDCITNLREEDIEFLKMHEVCISVKAIK